MTKKPCCCGFVPSKNKDEFEKYEMKIGSFMGNDLGSRSATRCKKCKETAVLIRQEVVKNEFPFEGLDSLKAIVDTIQNSRIPTSTEFK